VTTAYDAVVVGSGPNGLAAGIRLAQEKLAVLLLEGEESAGGGLRSIAATLPGFLHDRCAAVHPLGIASPFLSRLPLQDCGLTWVHPEFPLAHPLEHGRVGVLETSVEATAGRLDEDRTGYLKLIAPLVRNWSSLLDELLRPPVHVPHHPVALLRFLVRGARSATGLARSRFTGEIARALFAGLAAHSFLPLEKSPSASVGVVLGTAAHATGWPIARGGSGQIAEALLRCFRQLGGEIQLGRPVQRLKDIPGCRAILFDVTPRQFLGIAGDRLPVGYRSRLQRYRYGPGVFKLDYALSSPIPWEALPCTRAGTVHVGGTMEEVALAEREVAEGREPRNPFVLLAQPTIFDPSRAPAGGHVAWAYCHVPHGSSVDMTSRIETQIERFAPGFRDCILARHISDCAGFEKNNPNLVGGDISGGEMGWRQILARPVFSLAPYRTPLPGVYLCSASTPPGGGVHGMCGYHAAECALRDLWGRDGSSPASAGGV
jgi:phytoene dehydrogenase-like protein